jgi:hypothetical protein
VVCRLECDRRGQVLTKPTLDSEIVRQGGRVRDLAVRFDRLWSSLPSQVRVFLTQRALDERDSAHAGRERRIEQIGAALKAKYDLICFSELAGQLAKLTVNQNPYADLAHAVVNGAFDIGGKSQVFYLHPWSSRIRMTPAWMRSILEQYGGRDHRTEAALRTQYFDRCWVPREAATQRLAMKAPNQAGLSQPSDSVTPQGKKRRIGAKGKQRRKAEAALRQIRQERGEEFLEEKWEVISEEARKYGYTGSERTLRRAAGRR